VKFDKSHSDFVLLTSYFQLLTSYFLNRQSQITNRKSVSGARPVFVTFELFRLIIRG
jgi:hypothetical protein